MSLLRYLRRRSALLDELETLRRENAQLRYNLTTAWLASWIRRPATPPKAAAPPESALRSEPHPVRPGRHQARDEPAPTELHPRIARPPQVGEPPLNTSLKLLCISGAALLALTGCSATKTDAPEPTSSNIINGTNTQVIRMPDGFRNIAFTCYGSNGIYVTSRGVYQAGGKDATPLASSVFVLANDPHCGAK